MTQLKCALKKRLGQIEVPRFRFVNIAQGPQRDGPLWGKVFCNRKLLHCGVNLRAPPKVASEVYMRPSVIGIEFDGLAKVIFGVGVRRGAASPNDGVGT